MKLSEWFKREHLKNLEHEGFSHGSQGGDPENALSEIEAQAGQEKADLQHNYVQQTKKLEGRLEHLQKIWPHVEAIWRAVQGRLGDQTPAVVLPLALTFGGIFALCAEVVMLAPSLDPYGVVDPVAQYVFAFGIALASSIFFHYAYEALHSEDLSIVKRSLVYSFGIGATTALVFFGIVRGRQIAFAAELSNNPVGAFLGRYPVLTSIVFVCLTLGFPMAAAIATTNGLVSLRNWKQFVSAGRNFKIVSEDLPRIKKQLEAEKQKLEHQLESIEKKSKRWRHSYLVYHEKGVVYGTRQMALWMVWLKALAIASAAFFLCWPCNRIWCLLAIPIFLLAWVCFYHERLHPTPAEQFARQNIQFRSARTSSVTRQAVPLPLSSSDSRQASDLS